MGDDGHADDPAEHIITRTLDPEADEGNYLVLEAIADVEGTDVTDLSPMYERVDHVTDNLFSELPEPKAQVAVTFTDHGYRVTVDQEGALRLRRLEPPVDAMD